MRWRTRIIFFLIPAVTLFTSAGTLRWPAAWVFVLVFLGAQIGSLLLMPADLVEERSRIQPGTKSWDRVIAPAIAIVFPLMTWILAGLDHRYGWSPTPVPLLWWSSILLLVAGVAFSMWALLTNRFFSATVRIQTERGQHVVSHGPYAWVRHPGYLGMIAVTLGTPPFLESKAALIPTALCFAATVLRTALEDRTLRRELPGYPDYATSVRFRLLPGLW